MRVQYIDVLHTQKRLSCDYNRMLSLSETYIEVYIKVKTSFHFKNAIGMKRVPDLYLLELAHLPPNFTFSIDS